MYETQTYFLDVICSTLVNDFCVSGNINLEKLNAVGADMTDAVIMYVESMPRDVYAANTVPYIEHTINMSKALNPNGT